MIPAPIPPADFAHMLHVAELNPRMPTIERCAVCGVEAYDPDWYDAVPSPRTRGATDYLCHACFREVCEAYDKEVPAP